MILSQVAFKKNAVLPISYISTLHVDIVSGSKGTRCFFHADVQHAQYHVLNRSPSLIALEGAFATNQVYARGVFALTPLGWFSILCQHHHLHYRNLQKALNVVR